MCGVRKTGHRHPARHKVCPHTAAITHQPPAEKQAAIMLGLTLNDHKLPGSHTRSLNIQRQAKD
jgi:hypothetical protein